MYIGIHVLKEYMIPYKYLQLHVSIKNMNFYNVK